VRRLRRFKGGKEKETEKAFTVLRPLKIHLHDKIIIMDTGLASLARPRGGRRERLRRLCEDSHGRVAALRITKFSPWGAALFPDYYKIQFK
jgi:hypothetical protein